MTKDRALDEAASTPIYRYRSAIEDEFQTASSLLQRNTIEECLPFLDSGQQHDANTSNLSKPQIGLFKEAHVSFVQDALGQYPSGYVVMDASRPWTLYWSLLSLYLLDEDVRPYRAR